MSLDEIVKMIEDMFANGKVKQVASKEMIRALEQKGIERDDIDDILDEAERREIVEHSGGFYIWLDPCLREAKKAKIQQHFEVLAEIFKYGKIDFLPRDKLIAALKEREFHDEEIRKMMIEAERDHVLSFPSRKYGGDLVAGCRWIPPEERKDKAEAEKAEREFSKKWYEKKAMQEEMWKE